MNNKTNTNKIKKNNNENKEKQKQEENERGGGGGGGVKGGRGVESKDLVGLSLSFPGRGGRAMNGSLVSCFK